MPLRFFFQNFACASLAQLAEHMLRKHRVVGSIPTGGYAILAEHATLTSE